MDRVVMYAFTLGFIPFSFLNGFITQSEEILLTTEIQYF